MAKNEPQAAQETAPLGRQAKVQGVLVFLPFRFAQGQKLEPSDYDFLNSMTISAAVNAFGDRAKALKEEFDDTVAKGKPAQTDGLKEILATLKKSNQEPTIENVIQTATVAYYDEYVWSPRGAAEVLDPVERKMRTIARNELDLALRAESGTTLVGLPKEMVDPIIADYVSNNEARLRKQAEKEISDARKNVGGDILAKLATVSANAKAETKAKAAKAKAESAGDEAAAS